MNSSPFGLITVFSCAVCALLIIRPFILRRFGPTQMYQMWFAVPICLIGPLLPDTARLSVPIGSADVYRASINEAITSGTAQHFDSLSYTLSFVYISGVMVGLVFMFINFLTLWTRSRKSRLSTALVSMPSTSVPIYLDEKANSPSLIGIINPAIHIPTDFYKRYNSYQQSAVIKHELYHHYRKDIFCNLIAHLVVILFWFNPLSWLGYRAFRQDQELSCDEAVLKGECNKYKQEYARALLTSNAPLRVMTLQTSFGNKGNMKMMKERISSIQKGGSYSRLIAVCSLVFATVIATAQLQASSLEKEDSTSSIPKTMVKPIVQIQPKYPEKAKEQGIEGWVVVEFGVTSNGTVENIRIIDSHPENTFDEAAKRAVAKWRYMPNKVDSRVNTVELEFTL